MKDPKLAQFATDIPLRDIIESARHVLDVAGYLTDQLWHISDIGTLCEAEGWPVPAWQEAKEILNHCAAKFDGSRGLNWQALREATVDYLTAKGYLPYCRAEENFA